MTAHAFGATRVLADLEQHLDEFLGSVAGIGQTKGLVSLTLPTPRIPVHRMPAVEEGALFWAHPEEGCVRLGLGRAFVREATGDDRIEQLDAKLKRLSQRWYHRDPSHTALSPRAFTGFAFDPGDPMQSHWTGFPNAVLTVPSLLYETRGDACAVTFTGKAIRAVGDADRMRGEWMRYAATLFDGPPTVHDADVSKSALQVVSGLDRRVWEDRVSEAVAAIRAGTFDKVVLSRRARVEGRGIRVTPEILEGLAGLNPGRVQFAVTMGGSTLFGSSPEHLVSFRGGTVWSDAVAGTRLFPAKTAAQDRISAFAQDAKTRWEQTLVVDAIAAALRSCCRDVHHAPEPSVVRFARMGHLWTRIAGKPRNGVSLLELASALHPTPAVGGSPSRPAIDWLERHGEESRGWYTGAIGWIDLAGCGTLSVVLRCALVQGSAADIFAGAGIVEGSEPRAEFEETQWKLRSMLEVLGVTDVEPANGA